MSRSPAESSARQGPLVAGVRLAMLALATVVLALGVASPDRTRGQTSSGGLACSQALSGPIFDKWTAVGGEKGPLGCPTDREQPAPTSPQGSNARGATFGAATILWHASGPHAGQTYVVTDCFYRLYFQYGGPDGWLGLPLSDATNTPDGLRQLFEGGSMTLQRATNDCSAERAAQTAAAAAPGPASKAETSPLDQFYDPARQDYLAVASASGAARAQAAHYQRLRNEGYVMIEPFPGAVPLKAFWNEALGAHDTVAGPDDEREALAAGYLFDGAQGFIYADPRPGTRPLKRFWNAARRRGLVTATPEGEADATAQGYAFVRIDGYVLSAPG